MDRLSELARDVRRAADEVVARVELMVDAAPKDYASRAAFLHDVHGALSAVSEMADIAAEKVALSIEALA